MRLENRFPPPLITGMLMLLMAIGTIFLPREPISNALRFGLGSPVAGIGLLLTSLGFFQFKRAKTTISPVKIEAASAIVSDGVFRHSRNPMYVGFTLILVGWAGCLARPWLLLAPASFIAFMTRYQIIPEERVLTAKFGRAYTDYQARVRRWL